MSGDEAAQAGDGSPIPDRRPQKRSTRVEVNGWINLDKPVGVTSTQAVGRLKFLFNARKAGHAGTLDPLASGVLPVAFGEATKTVPIVQDGAKAYRFRVRWGEESATDDAEGAILRRSDRRPAPSEIEAALPGFVGLVQQVPPTYSAIKIEGARAYDLARGGESFAIEARPIQVYRLAVVSAEVHSAVLEAECGKGTYIRAIARDLGRALGCYGHVVELRRTRVGPFVADFGCSARPPAGRCGVDGLRPVAVAGGTRGAPFAPSRSQWGGAVAARAEAVGARRGAGGGTRLGRVFWNSGCDRRDRGWLLRVGARVQ